MNKLEQLFRARAIARSLGYFTAARYLAKRGWSIEGALFGLLKASAR
jgi:hypothetical protein